MKSLPLAFAVVAAAVACGQTSRPENPVDKSLLQADDVFEWETVEDPRLSPDGKLIVFERGWSDRVEDRPRREIWIMERNGDRKRRLVTGSSPRWSPDGTRVAYLADGAPRGTQLHVVWIDTGQSTQLTRTEEAPSAHAWSPDGAQIACNLQVPEKEGFKIDMPKPPKGAKWVEDAKVITRLKYRRDQSGYAPSGYRHVFVVPADGGTPRQVTNGDFDHGEPQWSADGREIVCDGLRSAEADWAVREQEIYAVDVATGATRTLSPKGFFASSPVVVGANVVYRGFVPNGATHQVSGAYVVALKGGEARALTTGFDRSVRNVVATPGKDEFWFDYEDRGDVRLARVSLTDGTFARDLGPAGAQFALSDVAGPAGGGRPLGVVTSPLVPPMVATLGGDGVEPLARVNDDLLAGKRLGSVEELRWKSKDGLDVQGWLVKPPGFDPASKYPLVLQIHGGPHAMFGVNFDLERQWFAAKGYLLLYTNPRGSTGYGEAFACGIQNDYPGKDYDDLMTGVDAAIARGSVDTDRLFVYGGSGGGVLTCWIVGSTDRFRAAVSMFPVTNWVSFVGTTDGPYWYENFKKLPWEDVSEHWRRSPLRLVGNVKTPTMLLTGELDLRTPMSQTEEYYQALKMRRVDTALVRIQDEFHGATRRHPSNRVRRMLYVESWFKNHATTKAGR
jgi:dipeptidyl aminopeptidase/acylaminoacyl peptidase